MSQNGTSTVSELKKYADEMNAMFDTMEQGIKEVMAINPPQEIEDTHNSLINSLKLEWEWIQLHRALFASKNDADMKSLEKDFDLWNSECDAAAEHDETFMQVYMKLKKQLQSLT